MGFLVSFFLLNGAALKTSKPALRGFLKEGVGVPACACFCSTDESPSEAWALMGRGCLEKSSFSDLDELKGYLMMEVTRLLELDFLLIGAASRLAGGLVQRGWSTESRLEEPSEYLSLWKLAGLELLTAALPENWLKKLPIKVALAASEVTEAVSLA